MDPTTNVRVGSIDTGIVDHPWLEGRVEVRGDEDYDVPVPLGEGEAPHGFAHGTAGAGQIVRKAPNATVVVRRAVLHDGLIDDLALAESLLELGDQGVRVISLAENGYTPGDAGLVATDLVLRRFQLEHPDLVVVAAAGNHGFDRPSFPATSPGVVAVGATDSQGKRAYFSNFGGWIDACAEGVDITVAFPSGKVALPHLAAESFENFAVWSGTSFATPSVVGAIAAKIGAGMTAREAVADLISTADETRRVPGLGTRID